jgi:hypothetical protein
MRTLLALAVLPLLAAQALADEPQVAPSDGPKQPRTMGQKAVLHVYYYAPKTLEITYVDSYLFKDEDACKSDMVSAKCVGLNPPEIAKPDGKHESPNSTDL